MLNNIILLYSANLKKVIGKGGVLFIYLLIPYLSFGQGNQSFSTAGTHSFTVPAGVTSITVECWGGGGAGGAATGNPAAGGGGAGGAYARITMPVTPGTNYTNGVIIGAGATGGGGAGNSGNASYFINTSTVYAQGGAGGALASTNSSNGTGGTGLSSSSVGSQVYRGGNGANGIFTSGTTGGAGGGGAGSASFGNDGTAGIGGALNGFGGAGANGVANSTPGATGSTFGGGGSGGKANGNTNRNGGSGANGGVIISWTQPIFYSQGTNNHNVLTNWDTNRGGGGYDPTNIAANYQTFVVQSGHTVTVSAAWILGTNGIIIIENGGVLIESSNVTIPATGTLQIDNGGLLNHNVNNANIFGGTEILGASSTISYGFAGAQNVFALAYGNLTIAGGNTKTIQGDATVNGTLNLSNGNLALGTYNLTIASVANITGSFDATHMIVCNGGTNTGSLIRQGDDVSDFEMTYPVGSGTSYTPVILSAPLTATVTGTASISINTVPNYYSAGGAISSDLNRYWTVSASNISGISANLTFDYTAADVAGTEADYKTAYYLGTNWDYYDLVITADHNAGASAVTTLSGIWSARVPAVTYYSYKSGGWDTPNTWTTDASGTLSVNPAVPGAGNNVVILNGRTVTTQTGGLTIGSLQINEGGILDISTFTHSFGTVRGKGTLKLSSSTFPTGNFNEFVGAGCGTVEYYNLDGTSISNKQLAYNNLIISNNTNINHTVYLDNISNPITNPVYYTINGDFTLKANSSGSLTFNFGRPSPFSDNLINMTVYGNFTVNKGCSVGVNNFVSELDYNFVAGNTTYTYPIHNLNLYGNLTNYGSVRFTGLPSPVINNYYTLASNRYNSVNCGDVQVTFKGATNNTLTCNGVTDFYRLIVDKGTDQTYTLEVNSSNITNFALYSPNNQGGGTKTGGPDGLGWGLYYKALFIHSGTLKLNENITIPSLSEGGLDLNILPEAGLWINGADVSTTVSGFGQTSGSYQALTLCGKLQISAGQLSTGDATGIVLHKSGTPLFQIEGTGILDISEFWVDKSGSNLMTYIQTGGTVNVRMNGQEQDGPMMDLGNTTTVFKMSGGIINFTDNLLYRYGGPLDQYRYNVLDIGAQAGNYEVTGGTINFDLPSDGNSYTANSTVPLYNLNISRRTGGGTVTVQWNTITSVTPRTGINNPNLTVLNDLNIGANSALNLGTNTINLQVGNDFTIATNGSLTSGNNTTTFNGIDDQLLNVQGILTDNLNDLILAGTTTLTLNNNDATIPIVVDGNFTIGSGCTFVDNNRILELNGSTGTTIYNAGTHFKPGSGAGSIRLTGTTAQTITGDGHGSFNNLYLDKSGGSVTMTSDMAITGELHLAGTAAIDAERWSTLNIGSNNLLLGSSSIVYSDMGTGTTDFYNYRMIQTSGLMSDGGVGKTYNSTTAFIFPFGFNRAGTYYYMPASIRFSSAPVDYGTVTTRPVMERHYLAQDNTSLSCYWHTTSTGFTGIPVNSVVHQYNYTTAFINAVAADEYDYRAGVYRFGNAWTYINDGNNVDEGNHFLSYDTAYTADGDYTAGIPATYGAVTVLYSINGGGSWSDPDTWSATRGVDDGNTIIPSDNVLVNIVDGCTVTTPVAASAGGLFIEEGSTLDLGSVTGHNFAAIPEKGVTGAGTLRIASSDYFPQADFGNFLGENGGIVEYYTTTASIIIPTASVSSLPLGNYRKLVLSPSTGYNITLPDTNLTIYDTLLISGTGTTTATEGVGTPSSAYTYTVNGELIISSGLLEYRGAAAQTFNVLGNTTIEAGAIFRVNDGASAANVLNLYGNLENNGGGFDMNGTPGKVSSYFLGTKDDTIRGTAGATLNYDFYTLTCNKGTDTTSVLTLQSVITTSGSTNFLVLNNGTFCFDGGATATVTISGGLFEIPSTACLSVKSGTATIGNDIGDAGGVKLYGKLQVMGTGVLNIGNPANDNNNDIEYAAAGSPTIEVSGGTLNVNGQIRRNTTNGSGSLVYHQSGGDVVIYGKVNQATRAKLEILNLGSEFNMSGGSITIFSAGGTDFKDLYLRPTTSNVTGGTIKLGNATSTALQNFNIIAEAPLWNLSVGDLSRVQTATLNSLPVTIRNQLEIKDNSVFSANGFNVTLGGNLINNNTSAGAGIGSGGYLAGSATQITTFDGSAQTITGTGSNLTNFANVVVNSSGTLSLGLNSDIQVNGNLTLNSGTLDDNNNSITLIGDVENNATHSNSTSGGIVFAGSLKQNISGNGSGVFGNVILNNPVGVDMKDNTTINGRLTFTQGSLYVDDYLLTLGANATIGGTNDDARMIIINGVLSDQGVKKIFGIADPDPFTYPIGIAGKYTPATFDFSSIDIGNIGASVTIKPINDLHKSVENVPALTNYLNYYWGVTSSGFTNPYSVSFNFTYSEDDRYGSSINEDAYIAQRYDVEDNEWYDDDPIGTVTSLSNLIVFPGVTTNLDGEYTAGQSYTAQPMLYSINPAGAWNTIGTWSESLGGSSCGYIPAGHPVTIVDGHSISLPVTGADAYSVDIQGTLVAGTTTFHDLGHVSGDGRLSMEASSDGMFVFPGGEFDIFMADILSIVEFTGNNNGTLPLKPGNFYKPYNNVELSGTSIKYMSAENLKIKGELDIASGSYLDNTLYNKNLYLLGNWSDENTTTSGFVPGTGMVNFVATGAVAQDFTKAAGTDENFYNVTINNTHGLDLTGSSSLANMLISKNLYLTSGNILTKDAALVKISNASTSAIIGGGTSSFINGPLSKYITSGQYFNFPVGNNYYGNIYLSNTSVSDYWVAQYYNADPRTLATTINSPLTGIDTVEYWKVTRPGAATARVRLRWDSPIASASSATVAQLTDAATDHWDRLTSTASGTTASGIVATTANVANDNYTFTIGIVGVTATLGSPTTSTTICDNGTTVSIPVTLTGPSPYILKYTDGATIWTTPSFSNPNFTIDLSGTDLGFSGNSPITYPDIQLFSVTGAGAAGAVSTNKVSVTVNPTNKPVILGTFTVGVNEDRVFETTPNGSDTYTWLVTPATSSSFIAPSTSTSNPTTLRFTATGTYTLQVTEITAGNLCPANDDQNITVNSIPTPVIEPATANVCGGHTIRYETFNNPGHTYTWTVTGGTPASGTGNFIDVTWNAGPTPGTITVVENNGGTTGSDVNTYSVSAAITGIYTVSAASASVCSGAGTNINLNNSQTDVTYRLRDTVNHLNIGTTISGNDGVSLSFPTGNLTTATQYGIYAFNSGCKVSMNLTPTVTVNPRPTPTFTTQPGATGCTGTSVIYETESLQSGYVWSIPGVAGTDYTLIDGGTGFFNLELQWITDGSKTVTINYSNGSACSAVTPTSSAASVINLAPTADAGTAQSTCDNTNITIDGAATNFSSISWIVTSGGSSFSGSTDTPAPLLVPDATGANHTVDIQITVNGNTGCTTPATDSKTVTIYATPNTSAITHD